MTGYIAAALRSLFDPRDLGCLDFCDTFHVEFVATRYPGHENQHGQNYVNRGGEFDVLSHDQNVAQAAVAIAATRGSTPVRSEFGARLLR